METEELPPAPTLFHAMVAIGAMLEVTSLLTAGFAIFAGREHVGLAVLFGYAVSSVVVSFATAHFLSNRNVPAGRIWNWPAGMLTTEALPGEDTTPISGKNSGAVLFAEYREEPAFTVKPLIEGVAALVPWLMLGAVAGAALGALAHGYTLLLQQIPWVHELMKKSAEQMAKKGDLHLEYAILAVFFAPFAEEFLFRGLLYRTLDREWGGWKAVVGSAAFFTIYHPPLAWIPVFTVGAANAMLFKKSGKLLPAVALHMMYNLVVSVW